MISLNYTEYGQGRPILILHGLFGSNRNWQGIARSLSENHRIITPDLRNHGKSGHADGMSYEEMADDIIFLINNLKLNNVILIGHSMGGKVAMTLALNYPDYISALIIVDIAPVHYNHNFKHLIEAMTSLDLSSLKNRNDAEAELNKVTKEKGVVQFVLQNLIREDNKYCWRINLQQIAFSLTSISQFPEKFETVESRLPTLFLGGSESNYIRSIHNQKIFDYFPSAEIIMLDGAGHWLHAEKPEEFLNHVKTFINYV